MISRITGEIAFRDGLQIQPHSPLPTDYIEDFRGIAVAGWKSFDLGVHDSDHGAFEVTALSDHDCRIQLVLLSHSHPFYRSDTSADAERRAFHEGVINSDLGGQREFSWGRVYCRCDPAASKDALIVAYAPGPQVPAPHEPLLRYLEAEEEEPDNVHQPDQDPLSRP